MAPLRFLASTSPLLQAPQALGISLALVPPRGGSRVDFSSKSTCVALEEQGKRCSSGVLPGLCLLHQVGALWILACAAADACSCPGPVAMFSRQLERGR